jgi:hypothetical protein
MVNQSEAETVRETFRRYAELGRVRLLLEDLNRRGIRFEADPVPPGRPGS